MLKLNPKITYKGITVILSNPSRFDNTELLTGVRVSELFKQECFAKQGINIMSAEVRLKEDTSPFRPGTLVVLLLGIEAFNSWVGNPQGYTLGEIRGSIFTVRGLPAIPSYLPIDCVDMQDHESKHNMLLNAANSGGLDDDKKFEGDEKRRHGHTARSNYRFWLKQDCAKAFRIIANGGKVPPRPFEPVYKIWPSADEIINKLDNTKDEEIVIDLETTIPELGITCMGLGFADASIYVIPFVTNNYSRAYSCLPRICVALWKAIKRNCIVAHNGAAFDFFVLAHRYKIPIGWNVKDTMLMQHRCFPEVEKSLGHLTSLWTYEMFHKDESCFNFVTPEQHLQLLKYCGKDVYTTMLCLRAIENYAKKIPGLTASMNRVNASIRPYLTMTMQGIRFKDEMRQNIMTENDRMMTQFIRMSNILMGGDTVRRLTAKNKTSVIASPQKCVAYFHDLLGYPVVGRSKKTGQPSLGKKNIYKLRLKENNPVLDLTIRYRETAKESGSLKFLEWKDKDGKTGVEKDYE